MARYLPVMLQSVLEQQYKHFELILVDDGSTDDTQSVVEMYQDGRSDLKLIRLSRNMGLAAALNVGMEAASGDFIARMDADDWMSQWRLHDQVWFLLENPECDLVGTGADVFGAATDTWRSPHRYTDIVNTFLVGNPFLHPTIMFRRRLVSEGFVKYNEYLQTEEDYELWSRVLPSIKCHNLDKSLIRYRLHSSNNQRHPAKLRIKEMAIQQFLTLHGCGAQSVAKALAEYQCGGFIRHSDFLVLREYAHDAEKNNWPKLGFLHQHFLKSKSYENFYHRTSGKSMQFGLR